MKNEFNFVEVVERAKKALQIKADYELAERLNMKATSFNSRKKANSLPYEELLLLANSENLNMDWLLTGEGTMLKGGGANDEMNPEKSEVLRMFDRLDDEARQEFIYAAKKLVKACEERRENQEMKMMLNRLMSQQGQQRMAQSA